MSLAAELESLEQGIQELVKNGSIEQEIAGRIALDYNKLVTFVNAHRDLGFTVVMTIGSFDLLHPGHTRYLFKAKKQGLKVNPKTILIVGVDSDIAVKKCKGSHRPIIKAIERLEMLVVQRGVDYVTVIDDIDEKGRWYYGLLRMIKPDIFVAVEDSYPDDQKIEIEKFCGKLAVLPRQAQNTSSSMIIQQVIKADPELALKILKEAELQEELQRRASK